MTETAITRLAEADADLVTLGMRLAHLETQALTQMQQTHGSLPPSLRRLWYQARQQWADLRKRLMPGGEPIYTVDNAFSIHTKLDPRINAIEVLFRDAKALKEKRHWKMTG